MIEHCLTITLSESLRAWFDAHAREQGTSIEEMLLVAVECYADQMRVQRRRDDQDYDRMKVPKKDRAY